MDEVHMKQIRGLADLEQLDGSGLGRIAYTVCGMTDSKAALVIICDDEGTVNVSAMVTMGFPHVEELAKALEESAAKIRVSAAKVEAMQAAAKH